MPFGDDDKREPEGIEIGANNTCFKGLVSWQALFFLLGVKNFSQIHRFQPSKHTHWPLLILQQTWKPKTGSNLRMTVAAGSERERERGQTNYTWQDLRIKGRCGGVLHVTWRRSKMPRIARLIVKQEEAVYQVMSRAASDGYVMSVEWGLCLTHGWRPNGVLPCGDFSKFNPCAGQV